MNFKKKISPEQQIVFLLSNPFFSACEQKKVKTILADNTPVNTDTIYAVAMANGVEGFVYKNTINLPVFSSKTTLALQFLYKKTALKNILMLKETLSVLSILAKHKIAVIPLKGASASDLLFNDFGVYPSGDIDILVHPLQLEKTKQILYEKSGYKSVLEIAEADLLSNHYHLNLQKKNILLEVHWTLVKRYFNIAPDVWWQGSEQFEWNKIPAYKLSIEKYILYNIFRLYDHCFYPLRFFSLMAGIIDHHYDDIKWQELLDFAKHHKMKKLVVFALRLLNDILHTKIPENIAQEKIAGYSFIKSMILSGIFYGIKKQHLRMLFYTICLLEPKTLLHILIRRIFPSKGELRLRYELPENSKKIYLYYILNPFLLLFKKQENI